MRDPRTLLVLATVLGLVLAGTGVGAAGIAAPERGGSADAPSTIYQAGPTTTETNATTNDSTAVTPGAHLSGVVGVHRAEIEGEVDARSIETALNASSTNESKAKVVAMEAERLETRLQELEARLDELEAGHANGTIPEGAYQAQAATLTARTNALEEALNRTSTAGATLPPHVRAQYGVNVTRLGHLRSAAGNLTGPEVAAIAQSIAGPNPGRSGMRGPPAHAGPGSIGPDAADRNGSMTNRTAGPPENHTEDGVMGHGPSNEANRTAGPVSNGTDHMSPEQDQTGTQNETRRGSGSHGDDSMTRTSVGPER
jgi:hypothetical protein